MVFYPPIGYGFYPLATRPLVVLPNDDLRFNDDRVLRRHLRMPDDRIRRARIRRRLSTAHRGVDSVLHLRHSATCRRFLRARAHYVDRARKFGWFVLLKSTASGRWRQ